MIATPHALAGAFASRFARTPRGALAVGVISHLALDRIPHTDYRLDNRKAMFADLAAATLVTAVLARRHRLTDFFLSLKPLEPPGRLQRIFSLGRQFAVEVEAHPASPEEYRFLAGREIYRSTGSVPIAPRFAL